MLAGVAIRSRVAPGSSAPRSGFVVERADVLPVAKDRHAVAQPEHFGQAMRDVENRDAALSQIVEHAEEMIRFGRGERGRRLVEHQHAAFERERAGHLHELAVRGRQMFHPGVRRQREVETSEQVAGPHAHLTLEQHAPAPGELAPREDVPRHCQVGERQQLLIDHPDAVRERVPRSRERELHILPANLAGIRRHDPREDLEQRGLARAVLSDEGVRLAGPNREADAPERAHGAKRLVDVDELEPRHAAPILRTHAPDGRPRRAGAEAPRRRAADDAAPRRRA